MKYMVVETFTQSPDLIYKRLAERGRELPAGLTFVESWVVEDLSKCFQLMEASDPSLIDAWIAVWNDFADFEVLPVISSDEARTRALGADSLSE